MWLSSSSKRLPGSKLHVALRLQPVPMLQLTIVGPGVWGKSIQTHQNINSTNIIGHKCAHYIMEHIKAHHGRVLLSCHCCHLRKQASVSFTNAKKCRCGEDGNWNSYSLQLNLYAIVMLLLKGQSIQQLLQHLQGQHYSCYCYTCLRRSGQFILPSPPPPEKPSGRSVEQVQ